MMSTRRWYRGAPALLAMAALTLVPACGQDDAEPAVSPSATASTATASPSTPSSTAAPTTAPAAPAVSWQWVRAGQYRDWERAPGLERPAGDGQPGTASPRSRRSGDRGDRRIGATRFPEGATIVKDGYDEGGELAIVAVMQRLAR